MYVYSISYSSAFIQFVILKSYYHHHHRFYVHFSMFAQVGSPYNYVWFTLHYGKSPELVDHTSMVNHHVPFTLLRWQILP